MRSGGGVVSLGRLREAPGSLRIPLLLAAAAAVLYLVAAAGRDFWAPDEPDFAEHVREMLEHRSLLLPYENGKPYSEKPILFYWAVAATTPLSGGDVKPFATRLPSVLAGAALVFCAAAFAGRRGGEREALVAGAATAVAPIVFWQSQFLQVDALFSCLLMLSLVSVFFLEGEEGRGTRWLWVLRVSIALAVLTKGPLAIAIVGLVVLTRCATARSLRLLGRLQPLRSIFVFLLLVVPWYFFAARAGGPAYAYDLVVNQNWNRFFRAFDHIQPWWFYFESIWSARRSNARARPRWLRRARHPRTPRRHGPPFGLASGIGLGHADASLGDDQLGPRHDHRPSRRPDVVLARGI